MAAQWLFYEFSDHNDANENPYQIKKGRYQREFLGKTSDSSCFARHTCVDGPMISVPRSAMQEIEKVTGLRNRVIEY
ncbi:hypothetical protein CHS0354_041652 [Potamilus streckersoni]|uniref:Uncharacterized protein n=1 Tax=Potamilus streckersoni TaxID=2493646 RepID=A0AAE0VT12_9BIVA|nr:hypothetical protein CHS0354_041652 [Potamilus streckersoni]